MWKHLFCVKKVDKNEQKALANELEKVASMAEEVLHTEHLDCLETFCHTEITENYEVLSANGNKTVYVPKGTLNSTNGSGHVHVLV